MKAKASSLADCIRQRATNTRHGSVPWYLKLPPDVLADLDLIRRDWEGGTTGLHKRAMARAIIAEMQARGLPVAGIQGVERWLVRDAQA